MLSNSYANELLPNISNIIGFSSLITVQMLDFIDNNVIVDDRQTGIMEIGVHHGQFFIVLNQYAYEKSLAVDVFDNQHFNIDNSGEGNLDVFQQNLNKFDIRYKGKNVEIIKADSLAMRHTNFTEFKYRYISIDGGHTPNHVLNDLIIAEKYLVDGGVVILDDYFNHWWPSVTEGISKYLMFNAPTLVPFSTSPNKLWLCNLSYRDMYLQKMKAVPTNTKVVSLWGYPVIDVWGQN
jgi:hypothetical protein